MKTQGLWTLIAAMISVGGCTSKQIIGAEQHRGAVRTADGGYEFYVGKGIGAVLAQGLSVADDYPNAFMKLTVKEGFVDALNASGRRVRTVSFEVPDASIEATVRHSKGQSTEMETLHFRPGDPWISGYAQVGFGPDDAMKSSNGTRTRQERCRASLAKRYTRPAFSTIRKNQPWPGELIPG